MMAWMNVSKRLNARWKPGASPIGRARARHSGSRAKARAMCRNWWISASIATAIACWFWSARPERPATPTGAVVSTRPVARVTEVELMSPMENSADLQPRPWPGCPRVAGLLPGISRWPAHRPVWPGVCRPHRGSVCDDGRSASAIPASLQHHMDARGFKQVLPANDMGNALRGIVQHRQTGDMTCPYRGGTGRRHRQWFPTASGL